MANDRDRDDQGRFTTRYTDEDILDIVRKHEPVGTAEVADELGVTRQSADYRLRKLKEDGVVQNKKVGHTLIWLVADGG